MKTTARVLAAAFVAATAFAPAAFAGDRASDNQYLAAARCMGVVKASGGDTASAQAYLKAQRSGRDPYVLDRATTARMDGERAYQKAAASERARIAAACGEVVETQFAAGATTKAR